MFEFLGFASVVLLVLLFGRVIMGRFDKDEAGQWTHISEARRPRGRAAPLQPTPGSPYAVSH